MSQPIIGILGGMGPRATVVFEQRLLDALEGSDQALPTIFSVNDGGIPDRTAFLTADGQDPLDRLKSNADILLAAGANLICMPCNTAHASPILARLQRQGLLPIIDMPAAAIMKVERVGGKQPLVLCTRGTKDAQVYQNRSLQLKCQFPDETEQELVDKIIAGVKAGSDPSLSATELNRLIQVSDCDSVIIACTELSLIAPFLEDGSKPIIDAMDALIESTVQTVLSYTKREETK